MLSILIFSYCKQFFVWVGWMEMCYPNKQKNLTLFVASVLKSSEDSVDDYTSIFFAILGYALGGK